ncbi:MAG TPA: S53 family peptidase [Actinocrinis sp.]|nr:S53 family peptidase [Actinocrinis sp.]
MRNRARIRLLAGAATAALPVLALVNPAFASPASSTPAASAAPASAVRSCGTPARGSAACLAWVRTDLHAAAVAPNATVSGYGPADLQSAYRLPSSTAGSGQTVAIVDAFDDPNAAADLSTYRAQFGLPACTTANGCFRKINQTGGTTPPRSNGGWAQEISLDLDMVSAVCPNCHILLVEASSATIANLGAAVNEAASQHVAAISNSYGGGDESDASAPFYNHPGIAVTASSGDSGFGVEFPASSHFVTAVGGTTLTRSGSGFTQTAWSGAGSGCSSSNTALTGQASFNTGCSRRAVADVSADANPSTGVAVFDSFASGGLSGWLVFGGTSVASPIIASVYALAGNTASIDNNFPYTHSSSLTDVTSGSNGSCSPSQLCTARVGWDGPTGLGTPNGVGAF